MVDALLKQLFANPRMIELLIRAYLPKWADGVDYRTLEPLPTEHVTDDRRSLLSDMAWRLRSVDGGTEHVLMIEFQGRSEWAMAVRTTVYGGLAVQRIMRGDGELRSGGRRLALASLVLYHDDRPWHSPTRMGDLLEDSEPDGYLLVPPAPPDMPAPTALDLPGALLGLVCARGAERIEGTLRTLAEAIPLCGDEDLGRFLTDWVRTVLISRGIFNEHWGETMDMETLAVEYRRSLDELKKRERRRGREQGIRKGREQGIRKGREQGQVTILRRLTDQKFGPEVAERVSRLLAGTTDPAHLTRVSAAILDCDTAEDFLARVGRTRSS